MAGTPASSLDPGRTYTTQCGRISSLKETSGYIEWSTEQGVVSKVRLNPREDGGSLKRAFAEGDVVHFSAEYDKSSSNWVAHKVRLANKMEGVVYMGSDKALFVKSGPQQTHYSLSASDNLAGAIKLRPSDKVIFYPAGPTFSTHQAVLRATHLTILAHGIIDCLVKDSKCLGIYVRWRKCEDSVGQSPVEDRIYHMLDLPDIEPKYYLAGLRCTLTPLLLLKKRTKRLNLTSKFGTFTAFADGHVIKLPKNNQPGQVKVTRNASTVVIPFMSGDVNSRSALRPLRAGDLVEVSMQGDSTDGQFRVSVSVVLEGTVVTRVHEGGEESFEVACDDARFPIDSTDEEAVIGFVPLRSGDKVKFQVSPRGAARRILIQGEVDGRVYAPGIIRVRGTAVSAIYSLKTNGNLKPADTVVLKMDWRDTHYRVTQVRVAKSPVKYAPAASPPESPKAKQGTQSSASPPSPGSSSSKQPAANSPKKPVSSPRRLSEESQNSPKQDEKKTEQVSDQTTGKQADDTPPQAEVHAPAPSPNKTNQSSVRVRRALFPVLEPITEGEGGEPPRDAATDEKALVPGDEIARKIQRSLSAPEVEFDHVLLAPPGLANSDGSLPRFMGGLELPVEDHSFFSESHPMSLMNKEHDQVVQPIKSPPGFRKALVAPIGPPDHPPPLALSDAYEVEPEVAPLSPRISASAPTLPPKQPHESTAARQYFTTGDISRFIEEMGRLDASNIGEIIEQFDHGIDPTYEDESIIAAQPATELPVSPRHAAGPTAALQHPSPVPPPHLQHAFGPFIPAHHLPPPSAPIMMPVGPTPPPQPVAHAGAMAVSASASVAMYGMPFSPSPPPFMRMMPFAPVMNHNQAAGLSYSWPLGIAPVLQKPAANGAPSFLPFPTGAM